MSEKFDVIIVGGGIAGFTAMNEIVKSNRNLKICLLEGRDRFGGRVKTIHEPNSGKIMDMGGTWVGPQQTFLLKLLNELGIHTYKQFLSGVKIHDDGTGRLKRYTGTIPKLPVFTLLDTHLVLSKLNKMAREVVVGAPERCRHKTWDSMSLFAWCKQHAYSSQTLSLLSVTTRLVLGVESQQISLLYFLHYVAAAGGVEPLLDDENGAQDSRISGGSGEIWIRLKSLIETNASLEVDTDLAVDAGGATTVDSSSRIRFCLNSIVTQIDVVPIEDTLRSIDNNIMVRCSDGTVRYARKVLFCCPPSCLARICFTPSIPPWKSSIWSRSHAGCWTKVIVEFETAFWRIAGLSGSVVVEHPSLERPVSCIFDYCDHDATHPALVGFVPGDVGVEFASLSHAQQRAAVLSQFVMLFGPDAAHATGFHIMDWLHDPEATVCGGGGCPVDIAAIGFFKQQARYMGVPLVLGWQGITDSSVITTLQPRLEILVESVASNAGESLVASADDKPKEYFLGVLATENGRPNTEVPRTPDAMSPSLFFAGTETASRWIGYMDGAVESGQRAAAELLWSL